MKLFSDWTFNSVKKLFYQAEPMKIIRKQFVYIEGEMPKGIYFIRKGEFKVVLF